MPLKQEFLAKTLEALRSGKYEQARGSLREQSKLCCIGVAAVANGFVLKENSITEDASKFIGLRTDSSSIYDEQSMWINWNDIDKLSFPQIADLIEKQYD